MNKKLLEALINKMETFVFGLLKNVEINKETNLIHNRATVTSVII